MSHLEGGGLLLDIRINNVSASIGLTGLLPNYWKETAYCVSYKELMASEYSVIRLLVRTGRRVALKNAV